MKRAIEEIPETENYTCKKGYVKERLKTKVTNTQRIKGNMEQSKNKHTHRVSLIESQ